MNIRMRSILTAVALVAVAAMAAGVAHAAAKPAKPDAAKPAKPDAAKPAKAPAGKAEVVAGPWHVIGPFVSPGNSGFSAEFPPEKEIDLAKSYDGGLKWAARPELADGQVHELKAPSNGVTYLYRTLTASAATTINGYFGSDDGMVVFLNGKKVVGKNVPRGAGPDQDTVKLDLKAGENKLLYKVHNMTGGHGFYFALTPSGGGKSAVKGGTAVADATRPSPAAMRLAINDLIDTYGEKYPKGKEFLSRLDALEKSAADGKDVAADLAALRSEALLANPALDFDKILLVRRKANSLGLPQNWQGNSTLKRSGYDNELAVLSLPKAGGGLKTLYKPEKDVFVGDMELHWNADRLLFSMIGTNDRWQVFEVKTDGTGLRQVTPGDQPDVDNYDGCYLPDGRLIFCSTACYLGVPCVTGSDFVGSLYILEKDAKTIRQLTFDQDHSWCPTVLPSGRVLYTRWEYSDTPHYFTRILFEMNPDGTAQFEYYGSNSYWPNSLFYGRPVPGSPSKFVAIVSGHHGVARMGELVLFDSSKGRREADGVIQRIPGHGKKVEPIIADQLVNNSWPKFLHPYPLSDKYFIAAAQPTSGQPWGVYLVDVYDNMVLLHEEQGYAMFEPLPLKKTPTPPAIPDKVDVKSKDATVYLVDIYQGKGLQGVPRGTVKGLRVYTNHYSYRNMGGHVHVGIDGPWDAKRILGTVPVYEDGSAMFTAPANMPLVIEPLDDQGHAMQTMRSWYTAMPGEFASCVGCHEPQASGPPPAVRTIATAKGPTPIKPWYGEARGFSFEREVQRPVLQKHCVGCHDGQPRPDGKMLPDFRAKSEVATYKGGFTPAYEALHRYVYRPGNESDYRVPAPGEYSANVSELIQMLQKGHHGVKLDAEAWDRLVTWIDLNVPCHGTWSEHKPIPNQGHRRRMELAKLYANLDFDPEAYPFEPAAVQTITPPAAPAAAPSAAVTASGWPFDAAEAKKRQDAAGPAVRTVDLGGGMKVELVRIPAGEFVMGDPAGAADERAAARVRIEKPFWMARFEVTNEQYARFNPQHDSGYINMKNKDHDSRGYPADKPRQPVIRVSWTDAMAFCRWLSAATGEAFTLPTEAQWEYACRAGSARPFAFGDLNTDFAPFANLGDATLKDLAVTGLPPKPSAKPNSMLDWVPKETRFDDKTLVQAEVGGFQPNAWGLHDMHGNVAEWTRSLYKAYPYVATDGREAVAADGARAVRGGSWYDRPYRCTASYRLPFQPWQGGRNIGFRVVSEGGPGAAVAAK